MVCAGAQKVRVVREPEVLLTQAERLAEAKVTERHNVASLEAFTRREEERKKSQKRAVQYVGGILVPARAAALPFKSFCSAAPLPTADAPAIEGPPFVRCRRGPSKD